MSTARAHFAELAKLLADGDAPVFALDEERAIVFCNKACAGLFGLDVKELVGQVCAFHSPDDADTQVWAAAALCPPPKCFAGRSASSVVEFVRPDGQMVRRRGYFLPLAEGAERCPVLGVLETRDCSADDESPAEDSSLHDEVRRFRRKMAHRFEPGRWIGSSPEMTRARAQLELAATTRACVLIVGPMGAGKGHAAKTIHYSQRDAGPLVPFDSAVLETNDFRSALRALWARNPAMKEPAGTLLITDLDCLAAEAQGDLVEVLRSGQFRMRVVCTSTRPLAELVQRGDFLAELAARSSTITIELPPLAAHKQDVPLLAQSLLEDFNARGAKQVGGFSGEAIDRLLAYSWPGNANELAAMVREAHDRAAGGEITAGDLPYRIQSSAAAAVHPRRIDDSIVLEEFLARVERELIERALKRAKGKKAKAARLLGLTRQRLYRRLVQLGLERPDSAAGE